MRKGALFGSLLALILSACGGTTPAASSSCAAKLSHPPVVKVGTLVMATNATLPPMQYVDSNGNLIGMRIDLGNEIAKRLCLQAQWVNVPFDAMIPGVQGGRWDMINTGMFYTPARSLIVKLVPYEVQGVSVSVAKGNPLGIHSTQDLAGKKVAVEAPGYEYDTMIAINKKQTAAGAAAMQIQTFQTTAAAYQALQAGQIDAVVIIDAVVKYYAGKGQFDTAVRGLNPAPLALGFNSEPIANAVAQVLTDMKADGTYDRILDKYGATKYPGPYKLTTGPLS